MEGIWDPKTLRTTEWVVFPVVQPLQDLKSSPHGMEGGNMLEHSQAIVQSKRFDVFWVQKLDVNQNSTT